MSDGDAVPAVVEVAPGPRLTGTVRPPGDKSISHRAVLLSALADGTSTIDGLSDGDDVAKTIGCVRALGAVASRREDGVLEVQGGAGRLRPAGGMLDCGNSGTTLRLLCGVAAGLGGTHHLDGDASLRRRPMDRVAEPLRSMGAAVTGRGSSCEPPLEVRGGPLRAIRYVVPVASAQVKSAILLAGLRGDGPTTVVEPVATRTHTEEMLATASARIEVVVRPDGRHTTVWPSHVAPTAWTVVADPSQAAFFVVGAVLGSGSELEVRDVYVGEDRVGFATVLERMGAHVVARVGKSNRGDLLAAASSLQATDVSAREIPSLDEVPILAVAAAAAEGTTRFCDVAELRVKESDRLVATARLVRALGGVAAVEGDDLVVTGLGSATAFRRIEFDAHDDHRMAMAAVIAATVGAGGVVAGFSGVATSYPGFLSDLASLR
jgi:3-phosphoshikimate 1-carboxyvinyltransferase